MVTITEGGSGRNECRPKGGICRASGCKFGVSGEKWGKKTAGYAFYVTRGEDISLKSADENWLKTTNKRAIKSKVYQ